MADLLVYVEPTLIAAMFGDPMVPGARVLLPRDRLPLEHLGTESSLFLVTVEHDQVILVATLDEPSGDAIVRARDISRLLPRLGCRGVGDVVGWGRTPRILPPEDADLLRYELGLALWEAAKDRPAPVSPPVAISADDSTAAALLAAVFRQPTCDDARIVYADYLQDKGDPRGELITLQIARSRTGGAASEREQALAKAVPAEARAIVDYLLHYELRRGFLARATVGPAPVPAAVIDDPAWATVEEITCDELAVLVGRHLTAARANIAGPQLAALARHAFRLPFQAIAGTTRTIMNVQYQMGIELQDPRDWQAVMEVGGLAGLRALAISGDVCGHHMIKRLLQSALGDQLEHLEVDVEIADADTAWWRGCFDRSKLGRFALRLRYSDFIIEDATCAPTSEIRAVLERNGSLLTLQFDDVLHFRDVTDVIAALAPLGHGLGRICVEIVGLPQGRAELRLQELIAGLRRRFRAVSLVTGCRWRGLARWASRPATAHR